MSTSGIARLHGECVEEAIEIARQELTREAPLRVVIKAQGTDAVMQALLSTMVGGPETLTIETVADPVPGRGEVVIDVEACGVNFPDALTIFDKYQIKSTRPFSPGSEVCGFISAVGPEVGALAVGQRVIARCITGGMAERLCVTADRCLNVPEHLPAEQLATLQFTYGTAFHALRDRAVLREGETLLVLGAAGGVGTAAVELGKAFGARVIAACSSREKEEFAASRGADATVTYPVIMDRDGAKTFADAIKHAAGSSGVDVILDPIGGAYTEPALRAIGRNGRFLIVGFPSGIATIAMNLPLLKYCSIVGVDWRNFNINEPKRSVENSRALIEMYVDGRLKPTVSAVYPLSDAATAIRHMSERAVLGKVAIRIAKVAGPAGMEPRR